MKLPKLNFPRVARKWILVATAALALVSTIWLAAFTAIKPVASESLSGQTNVKDGFLIADLGGKKVKIPVAFAHAVEYDGEPSHFARDAPKRAARTPDSKIRSFGFDVLFPEMKPKDFRSPPQDKESQSIYTTRWLRAGISSGEHYPGPNALNNQLAGKLGLAMTYQPSKPTNYVLLPSKEYELEVYALKGKDPVSGDILRQQRGARDVYVRRGLSGNVETIIECFNDQYPSTSPCTHAFNLSPATAVIVSVDYRRTMLEDWSRIQNSIESLIISFQNSSSVQN
jgi:hypothetical protein